jgi:adenine C2-methylase RlmN of 23S rRNA A2503 and tRNA A37
MHIWRWLYDDGRWIRQFADTVGLQNGFSKAFADKAEQIATCSGAIQLQKVVTSSDGTRKLIFSIDGLEREQIEAVLIPLVRKQVCLDAGPCLP